MLALALGPLIRLGASAVRGTLECRPIYEPSMGLAIAGRHRVPTCSADPPDPEVWPYQGNARC